MSDTSSRGIANLATRRVDPKRMLARNRQTEEASVDESPKVEPTSVAEIAAQPSPAPSQPKAPRQSAAAAVAEDEAGYSAFERKEARLREEQIRELTAHARRLNKAKTERASRITENTLIRIAVDLLLARVDELQGATEADLRRSVGL